MQSTGRLKDLIRDVPDFPKKGIVFKDITPLLADPTALRESVEALAATFASSGPEVVAGIESRGFIFGTAVAARLGVGFVPVRKPGKLPAETIAESYDLEYGTDALEIHVDAISAGTKVLIVDDLLATGGTAAAAAALVRRLGGEIAGISFVIELEFLNGRSRLADLPVASLIRY
jgi:adenine phosphoribosyltransferase